MPVVILILAGLFSMPVSPSFSWEGDEPDKERIPFLNESSERKLDAGHKKLSERLVSAARWFDSFFDDPRYHEEENRTRARVRCDFGYSREEGFEVSPRFSLDLKIPRLSNKIHLYLSLEEEDAFDMDSDPVSDAPRHQEAENDGFTAGLQYFFPSTNSFNLSATTGLSFDYAYAGLRLRYLTDFGSWQGRLSDRFRYYTDDGWENKLSCDLERHFSGEWLFRMTAIVFWYENETGYPHSFSLRLYRIISEDRAIMYEAGHYYDTEPGYTLTDQQFRIRFRQRFYRDWLILEIAPQLTFPKDHGRDANPGIVVRLEAEFGYSTPKNRFGGAVRF